MIVVIDNYDSFVYNLAQYAGQLGHECRVVRNNELTVEEIGALNPSLILVSPGPGGPRDAGISLELIRGQQVPILGVCLGHQCIAEAFGARVVRAAVPMHGKLSPVFHRGEGAFTGLPSPLEVTRYHSLTVDPASLPDELVVTAWTETGEVMGLRHRDLPIEGVQFHPESLFTEKGLDMVANALKAAERVTA
ncbi:MULTISPECIES: anthranilate synthase component II [Streptomyces]|uniref:anthranilate synthase component II n=1 Tax=Streptomyces TaxID=1883 RepID=UPI001E511347|nr:MULTISPECIES: aminodeoxychorismate/anthranilate synthase component II [Streptomyces]UFQ19063.1 aminodeoxychorismate/anthranilate synthase component II [Streptomyces huasconensis]WCL88682.1 aminodeoxychorismate/anthranilate synthase component II [Streptomyces sp. JCM 35825]